MSEFLPATQAEKKMFGDDFLAFFGWFGGRYFWILCDQSFQMIYIVHVEAEGADTHTDTDVI